MGFFAHAQTVDTRPLFLPPTWPGYESSHIPTYKHLSTVANQTAAIVTKHVLPLHLEFKKIQCVLNSQLSEPVRLTSVFSSSGSLSEY